MVKVREKEELLRLAKVINRLRDHNPEHALLQREKRPLVLNGRKENASVERNVNMFTLTNVDIIPVVIEEKLASLHTTRRPRQRIPL